MTEQVAPRRAKLELLVRRDDDDESFEIREVASSLAFVQSRPQRVAPELFELAEVASRVAGQRNYILKNKTTDRFLLLSEQERFLWELMDGETSLQEMATAYVLKYGEFDFDIIPNLIRKVQRAQLLLLTPRSSLRRVLARNRRWALVKALESALLVLERVNISSRKVQPLFVRLYTWGGFLLFTRAAAALSVLVAVFAIGAAMELLHHADSVATGLGARPIAALLTIKGLFFATVAAHQIVHGLSLVHYQRRVREFGFTFLHGFVPTFYVDVTDIFMASRKARVVTAVSGAAVHLVLGSIWFIVALYPFCFIEMDGYHVLVDALGVPTLKHDAMAYVGRILRGGSPGALTREKALWLVYVALSALSIAAFIAFNIWLIIHATS